MFTLLYLQSLYGKNPIIVYDGGCPLCSTYVSYTRLKKYGPVALVNARDLPPDILTKIMAEYDLNKGMLFIMDDMISYGHEAIHRISLLTTNHSLFNKLCRFMFSHKPVAKLLYPFMVAGRKVLLILLGRKKIAQ